MLPPVSGAQGIVAGDTMRIGDSTALGRLHAVAFNIKKDTLRVPILWLTLDPLVGGRDGADGFILA